MKTVFLFPGQGSQYPGMGKDFWERSKAVKDLFRLASGVLGTDMEKLLFEGSEDELKATDKAQGAITLANLASARVLREMGTEPSGAAGFSLGEYAALAVAGVVRTEDVFALVKIRGELMEKASRSWDGPEGHAGMAAVLGLDYPAVSAAIAGIGNVSAANYNSPVQTVVSGTAAALTEAETALKAAGAKRVIRLKVSGPFHSPLLREAREAFERELGRFDFSDPSIPVFSNVTGKPVSSGKEAKDLCGRQIVSPVLWVEVERSVKDAGFERILETGPGNVLGGLWKALYPDLPCRPVGKAPDLEAFAG